MFVKSIDTLPALAVSEVSLNSSRPSKLSSRLSAPAGVGAAAVLAWVEGVVRGVDAAELVVLEPPPQPASTNAPSATVSSEAGRMRRVGVLALSAVSGLTGFLHRLASVNWGDVTL